MEKFLTVLDLLENRMGMEWDYVEKESENSCRFDFAGGELSLWVNNFEGNVSAEGQYPRGMKEALMNEGVKIY